MRQLPISAALFKGSKFNEPATVCHFEISDPDMD